MDTRNLAVHALTGILGTLLLAAIGQPQSTSVPDKQLLPKPGPPTHRPARGLRPPGSPRAAPPGPVESCAEWETARGVMTLWANFDLMDELQARTKVYVPVDDASQETWWRNQLNAHGIPLTNFEFLYIPTATIWTRDYGPFFAWDGNGELTIVDYDSWGYGGDDDLFPSRFAARFGIDYYDSTLKHVGGNWYPLGLRTAFSSTMAYWANWEYTHAELDVLWEDYYGIQDYHTAPVTGWTIQHHDTYGKPANPETILVGQFPEDSEHHLYGEGMAEHYATLESPWGRPYRVLRIPMFSMVPGNPWLAFRPYLNALVSNGQVYVPITNHPDDQVALQVYAEAFPGYEIVAVDHGGCGWGDALHCRTRNFVDADAIRIDAYPPGDTEETSAGHPVRARVIPPQPAALLAGYPVIRWTDTGGAPFNDVVMSPTGTADEYAASIPAQALGTRIDFYVEARDDAGHLAQYPLVAPAGMLSFEVRQDTEAPVLSRFLPARSAGAGTWPPTIRLLCKDDVAQAEVSVECEIDGVPQPPVLLSREQGSYWYSGTLPGTATAGSVATYRVLATDGALSPNSASLPPSGEVYCPVEARVEIGLVELGSWSRTAPFVAEVLGGLGIPVTHYRAWPTDWSEHDVWILDLGVTPDNHILTTAQANELVAALQAGGSIWLESSDAWCYDDSGPILRPWFGVAYGGDGGNLEDALVGQSGTAVAGLTLPYRGENAYMDELGASAGALVCFRSDSDGNGRAVTHDAGSYRSIASAFPLGGLQDQVWPETRKEILLRHLEFLGVGGVELFAAAEGVVGTRVPIRIHGNAGEVYRLFRAPGEGYMWTPYGLLRLDRQDTTPLAVGTIPSSGVAEELLGIPPNASLVGEEIHLQALVGTSMLPGVAELTNREIVRIVE